MIGKEVCVGFASGASANSVNPKLRRLRFFDHLFFESLRKGVKMMHWEYIPEKRGQYDKYIEWIKEDPDLIIESIIKAGLSILESFYY